MTGPAGRKRCNMDIGRLIADRRKELGLTLEQVIKAALKKMMKG